MSFREVFEDEHYGKNHRKGGRHAEKCGGQDRVKYCIVHWVLLVVRGRIARPLCGGCRLHREFAVCGGGSRCRCRRCGGWLCGRCRRGLLLQRANLGRRNDRNVVRHVALCDGVAGDFLVEPRVTLPRRLADDRVGPHASVDPDCKRDVLFVLLAGVTLI